MNFLQFIIIGCKNEHSNRANVSVLVRNYPYKMLTISNYQQINKTSNQEETGTLIKTLASGHQMQWTSDSSIIYTTINTNLRPDTALFLNLETGEQHTVLQSCREDEVVSVTCSKDKKLTAVNVNTKLTSHVYLVGDQGEWCGEENLVHHPLQSRLPAWLHNVFPFYQHFNAAYLWVMCCNNDQGIDIFILAKIAVLAGI